MAFFERNIPPWELIQKALPGSTLRNFEFDALCLTKSEDPATGRRGVRGVASTDAKDLQGEEVVQKGLDLRYFVKYGYYNNDHKPGFSNKVGQPTSALIKRVTDSEGEQVVGLWTEGYLWPKGTHAGADSIWELGKALEAADADRHLAFSIQGKVLQRDGSRIVKAWVQDIAITPAPVNTRSWLEVFTELSKGLATTQRDVEDIRKSITATSFLDDPIIAEPWTAEMQGRPSYQQEINKAINFAYRDLLGRGYSESHARAGAFVAVSRSILA